MSPDAPDLVDAASRLRSAYVHIPFCAAVCPYCDFNVVSGADHLSGSYVDRVVAEIGDEPRWGSLGAVFFGGGTPSRIDPGLLQRVLEALVDRFGLEAGAEVSLEANPEDWDPQRAAKLVELGFDRVSFGAQSFDPEVLAALGRRHEPAQIEEAVRAAREAGFRSVNLDLIFGHPIETLQSWETTVARAVELEPDHLSTYALTVERGTELGRWVSAGLLPPPDPDDQADKWEVTQEIIGSAGLVRYEVSNSARPGHHCRYNLAVWAGAEYLGFGAGAHSYRNGRRRRNPRRIDAYLRGLPPAEDPADERERLMLGLRLAAGVRAGPLGEALWDSPEGARLREAGVLARRGDRLVVTRPLLTDHVVRALWELQPDQQVLAVSPYEC
jgi:oxygen-independent coproporphyrinogen-3 oxidase